MVDLAGDLGRPQSDAGAGPRARRAGRQSRHSGSHPFGLGFQQRKQEAFLALDSGAQERLEAGQVARSASRHLASGKWLPRGGVRMQSLGLRRDLVMVEPDESGRPRRVASGRSIMREEPCSSQAMCGLRSASTQCSTLPMPAALWSTGMRRQLLAQLVDPTDAGRQLLVFMLDECPDHLPSVVLAPVMSRTSVVSFTTFRSPPVRGTSAGRPLFGVPTTCSAGRAGWPRVS